MRRTIALVATVIALTGAVAACDVPEDDSTAADRSTAVQKAKQGKEASSDVEMTASQEQALASAENYLNFQAFSKKGLTDQLSSKYGDKFPRKDAEFAVAHLDVDWNEQAAKAAKDYLKFQAFSREGLIEQLASPHGDQFTHAEAVYGVSKTGL